MLSRIHPPTILIGPEALAVQLGTPACPHLIDVRIDEDFSCDPRLIPGSVRRRFSETDAWLPLYHGSAPALVICQAGQKLSQGVAATMRQAGIDAHALAGGFEAWVARSGPCLDIQGLRGAVPPGTGAWVCAVGCDLNDLAAVWFVRRFVDRDARFLFVEADETARVADRFKACDLARAAARWPLGALARQAGLETPALDHMTAVISGTAPESPGLRALFTGMVGALSDDRARLDAVMPLLDALYLWCRDASEADR